MSGNGDANCGRISEQLGCESPGSLFASFRDRWAFPVIYVLCESRLVDTGVWPKFGGNCADRRGIVRDVCYCSFKSQRILFDYIGGCRVRSADCSFAFC
jgi:hypothetical protein